MRPLCICKQRPAAINYYKNGKAYYRRRCEICLRYGGIGKGNPKWYQEGYRLRLTCDKCGFKSKYKEQFNVYHVDGNLDNNRLPNLKSVCANCQRILHVENYHWRRGELPPDF